MYYLMEYPTYIIGGFFVIVILYITKGQKMVLFLLAVGGIFVMFIIAAHNP